jgi:hypothetical protein
MKRFLIPAGWLLALCLVPGLFAQAEPTRQEREGQALVADLRAAAPQENSEIRGVLTIRSKKDKRTNSIPVICKIVTGSPGWDAIYEAAATEHTAGEKLIIRRFADRPNQYFYARAKTPGDPIPEPKELNPREADIPFAGSDFWITDLALDFLHWRVQRRLGGEGRLGRATHVLESIDPYRKTLPRIKSWIDKESGGVLAAEAFDLDDKLAKEFTLSGSSFKKIEGRWQLEKMEIRDVKHNSITILKFDLPDSKRIEPDRR